jgi:Leucine-rich repeat (LRR) protein
MEILQFVIEYLGTYDILSPNDLAVLFLVNKRLYTYILQELKHLNVYIDSTIPKKTITKMCSAKVKTVDLYRWSFNSCLFQVQNLENLSIVSDRWLSDRHLSQCVNLKRLSLPKNKQITDLGLSGLTKLEELNLYANHNITDYSLIKLPNLRVLVMPFANLVTDIAFEGNPCLKVLKVLNIGYNRSVSYTFLDDAINLKYLVITFLHKKTDVSAIRRFVYRKNVRAYVPPYILHSSSTAQ